MRIVRVPNLAEEDARRASRERDRLIIEQTAHSNRIKALLRFREWRSVIPVEATGLAGFSASATGRASCCRRSFWPK